MQSRGRRLPAVMGCAVLWAGTIPALAAIAPSLGDAASFAVLGGTAVTSSGLTRVTGNLGISPASTLTGFPPGTVTLGTTHRDTALARAAQRDSARAYDDLASRGCDATLTSPGGSTLVPGVYCVAAPALLSGTLILDAGGEHDAVWIFRIDGALTTAADSAVLTIDGAKDGNVFWQVRGSASIGARTKLVGNVLARDAITFGHKASLSGRALAQNGAVTLDTNDISLCCGTIVVSPAELPDGVAGTPYTAPTFTANGGVERYTFTASPSLPPGLELDGDVLTGIPEKPGTYTFAITATDALGCSGTREYTIDIGPCERTIELSPATLRPAIPGVPYDETLRATGGTEKYKFTVPDGALPQGLLLSEDGVFSGTPTAAACSRTFTVTVTDKYGCTGSRTYTICLPFVFTPDKLLPATGGSEYRQKISLNCPANLSADQLPPGMVLLPDGVLSGTPTGCGSESTFTVTAVDPITGCSGSHDYTLRVGSQGIKISPETLPDGTVCVPYEHVPFSAIGGVGEYRFTIEPESALPPGLKLTGPVISGAPQKPGVYEFDVLATDAAGCSATKHYAISITCPIVTLAPEALPDATEDVFYTQPITAGPATCSYRYTVIAGILPDGLGLDEDTGILSGTPDACGDFVFTIRAEDPISGCSGERSYSLVVHCEDIPPGGESIPTLTEWGMVLLAGLLAVAGFFAMRRSGV